MTNDFRRGQHVIVSFPDSEHRDERGARVLKAPPFESRIDGETVHDEVLVEYPNTQLDDTGLFGNMQESVPIENVRPDR